MTRLPASALSSLFWVHSGNAGHAMAAIVRFLPERENVFDPKDITAMSMALDDVCKTLALGDNSAAKEVIAVRMIALARTGERSPTRLRDRVLHEAGMAERVNLDGGSAATHQATNSVRSDQWLTS